MNFFIFADGYLQENENDFCYTVSNDLFRVPMSFEALKESNDNLGLELIDVRKDSEETNFIYKKEEDSRLLPDVKQQLKAKTWNKKRDWIAFSIVSAVKKEAEKGFFVLPIPENFLIGSESVHFIYKATKDMPITGFDATQLFAHVKRLIIYLYTNESFEELLKQKSTKTEDKFIVALASTENYEDLLALVPFKSNKPKQKKVIHQELVAEKPVLSKPKKVTEPKKIKERQSENKVSVISQDTRKIKKSYLLVVLASVLGLSVVMNGLLIFDKVTYPSQINLLKKENKALIEKSELQTSKLSELESESAENSELIKELKKTNEELEEEIETNVQTIKDLVDKNDELKKSIK